MSQSPKTNATDDPTVVLEAERDVIEMRRKKAWSTDEEHGNFHWSAQTPGESDYVGLALSGGGIRAASLGLGVLQTLCKNRLIKSVDYLSTVSGGGYIGSHFSSAVISKRVPPEHAFDDTPPPGATQPLNPPSGISQNVRKLIYGGKYLFRPWEAANKYLFGLVLINLSMFAAVIAFAALVAFAWRSMDLPMVRDFLNLFDLNTDLVVLFFPFSVFAVLWFVFWLVSRFQYRAEAPGRLSQRLMYFALASLLIGIVLLLVNGKETKVGFAGAFLGVGGAKASSGTLSKWLLGLLGASLLPLLQPKRLIEMGLSQKTLLERAVFRIATFAFLCGIPLAIIGLLGARNISRTASDPDDKLRVGDVRNWPAFAALVSGPYTEWSPTVEGTEKSTSDRIEANLAKGGVPSAAEIRQDLDYQVHKLLDERKLVSDRWKTLDELHRFRRFYYLLGWTSADNPVRGTWEADKAFQTTARRVADLFSQYVLPSPQLPGALITGEPLSRVSGVYTPAALQSSSAVTKAILSLGVAPTPLLANMATAPPPIYFDREVLKRVSGDSNLFEDEDNRETLNDARLSTTTLWRSEDAKEFNQTMLHWVHPECFYTPGAAYRWIVTAADQNMRLWIFVGATALCCVGLCVDMNRTSLHRFYRDRLMHAYLVPKTDSRPDVQLSDLTTTDWGAPYHLINTTLELTRPRFLDEIDKECQDDNADRRDRQIFLFSQLYCGATATGWIPTKEYESYLKDNISLGDAMALSGAAANAMYTNSLPLTVLMTGLNLTLGQWLPNPSRPRPRSNPRAWMIFRDWFRQTDQADYAFVCDGGFTENLGIMPLLRRRCQVIIAFDSGCDLNQEFSDLGVLIRSARIQEGIEILDTQNPFGPERTLETNPLVRDKNGNCKSHFLIGKIKYPRVGELPASEGWLIYLKPSFTSDEGSELLDYRRKEAFFPHHPTTDQFYDAVRFESYRQLGIHIAETLCNKLKPYADHSIFERIELLLNDPANQPARRQRVRESAFTMSTAAADAAQLLKEMSKGWTTGLRDDGPEDSNGEEMVTVPKPR